MSEEQLIATILTSKQTIHWTYSEQEWRAFATQSWHRANRGTLLPSGFLLGLLLLIGLLVLPGASKNAGVFFVSLAMTLGVAVFLVLLAFVSHLLTFWARRRRATTEVYINAAGLILSDSYKSLAGLRRITYEAGDPGVLRFFIGSGRGSWTLEVPVPHLHEGEARNLAQSFTNQ